MAITGKGMYIWKVRDVYGGDVVKIADRAKADGLTHVVVKIADGHYRYNITNGVDMCAALVPQLKARGIKAWGWQYVYGRDAVAEAVTAATLTRNLGLDGFVVNAEKEFKAAGMTSVAKKYMQRLRQELPNTPIALISYRYPTLHAPFPFKTFLDYCDLNMPEVYWQGASNAAQQLRRSVQEYRAIKPNTTIVPCGSAYGEHGWRAKPAEIIEFLNEAKAMGLPGANFWEWGNALQDEGKLYAAIQAFSWGGVIPQPEPEPEPEPQPEPEPVTKPVYIRLKHDKQWMSDPATGKRVKSRMERSDWNPSFSLDSYPAVVAHWLNPNGGDGAFPYTRAWAQFLRASNPQQYTHLERIAAGLFNPRNDQSAFPADLNSYNGETVAEAIGATGNVYEVLEEKPGSVRLRLIDFQSAPSTPAQLNYEDTPWLVTAFTAVGKDGRLLKTTGRDLVFPNLGRPGAGWVPKERVEFFPALPFKATVVISDRLNVRKAPGTHNPIVDRMTKGQSATVTEYRPQGSSVWGKIGEDRWIALVFTTSRGPEYYTNWKMETEPPIPLADARPYLKPMLTPEQQQALPKPDGGIVDQYFAVLNKANANQAAALYNATTSKLVAEERAFSGTKAITNWYIRLFNNKLPGATFTPTKVSQNGNFYNIEWTAKGKKSKVLNGRDMIRVSDSGPQVINYHYTEFKVVK